MSEEPGRHRAHVGRGLAIVGTKGLETIDVLLISVDSANIGEEDRGDLLDVSRRGSREALALARELRVDRRCRHLNGPAGVPLMGSSRFVSDLLNCNRSDRVNSR